MSRIAISHSLVANGGDAAILLGTLRVLRDAFGDAEVTVYDALPEVARRHYPELDVRPALHLAAFPPAEGGALRRKLRGVHWLHRRPRWLAAARAVRRGRVMRAQTLVGAEGAAALRELADAGASVASGGTYLVETYWLGPTLLDAEITTALGVPQGFLTQSLGPFGTTRGAVARALRALRVLLLRDDRSLGHARTLGLDVPMRVSADTAFALAEPDALAAAAARRWPDAPRVAVSVRDWPYLTRADGQNGYEDAVGALVTHLVRTHGAAVDFVSTCQGNPEYRYDDAAVAARIANALPDDVRGAVTVEPAYHRPEALLAIYGAADLVVATRMHAAILALSAGTPVLPISYEFKTAELFARLGAAGWCVEIETITGDALVARADVVIAEVDARRGDLMRGVEAMRAEARRSADDLRAAFPELVPPAAGSPAGAPC